MVKVMYTDQLVYKVVIWVFFGIGLWTEKVALNMNSYLYNNQTHSSFHIHMFLVIVVLDSFSNTHTHTHVLFKIIVSVW